MLSATEINKMSTLSIVIAAETATLVLIEILFKKFTNIPPELFHFLTADLLSLSAVVYLLIIRIYCFMDYHNIFRRRYVNYLNSSYFFKTLPAAFRYYIFLYILRDISCVSDCYATSSPNADKCLTILCRPINTSRKNKKRVPIC